MQEDYTIFRIPNQPKKQANDFGIAGKEALVVNGVVTGDLKFQSVEEKFPFYDELNNIAEELEKCRLRNS